MTIGEVLAPVRERYAAWLGLDAAGVEADHEDPDEIRALQLVLRLERDETPSRARALALAATACARLCLDDRSAPGGPWHEAVDAYCRGHIRKVTRRARGAGWTGTAALPGITLTDGPTQVRALLPGRVADLDKRVAKLQVGGTDLPVDDAAPSTAGEDDGVDTDDDMGRFPDPADLPSFEEASGAGVDVDLDDAPVLVCHLPASRRLTAGKLMAQTGHAGMIAAALASDRDPALLEDWFAAGCPARAVDVDDAQWAELLALLADPATAWEEHRLVAVRDAGYTEVEPGTITVAAHLV